MKRDIVSFNVVVVVVFVTWKFLLYYTGSITMYVCTTLYNSAIVAWVFAIAIFLGSDYILKLGICTMYVSVHSSFFFIVIVLGINPEYLSYTLIHNTTSRNSLFTHPANH